MPLPDVAFTMGELARGKRVLVVVPGKDTRAAQEPPPEDGMARDDEVMRDIEARIAAVAQCAAEAVGVATGAVQALRDLSERIDASQAETRRALARVEATLLQPVRPVYDTQGKLIGAERVRPLPMNEGEA